MTFLESELSKIFDGTELFINFKTVGNTCYGSLTDDIRVKMNFEYCSVRNKFDALRITLLKRNEGQIDSVRIRFEDMWGLINEDLSGPASPYIWSDEGKTYWYGYKPTNADYNKLVKAAKNYLEMFEEPVHIHQMEPKMY